MLSRQSDKGSAPAIDHLFRRFAQSDKQTDFSQAHAAPHKMRQKSCFFFERDYVGGMGLKIINDTSIPVAVDSSVYFDDKHLSDDFCKVLSPGESVVLRDEALTDENRSDVCLINASDGSFKDKEGAFNIEEKPKPPPKRQEIREIDEEDLKRRLYQKDAQTKDILTYNEYKLIQSIASPADPEQRADLVLRQLDGLIERLDGEMSDLHNAKMRVVELALSLPEANEEEREK